MSNLLDRSSLVLTPTAYNNGEALCIKPDDASGDFQFSRNSAATRVNAQGLVENVQILSSNLVQNGDFSEEGSEEVSNGSFSQEGVELITNGDFSNGETDWDFVSTSELTEQGARIYTPDGSYTIVVQNNVLVVGKQYKVTFDVIATDGSSLSNGSGSVVYDTSTIGSKVFYITTDEAGFALKRISGITDVTITNFSVREVGQDWDLGTGWSIAEDKVVANLTSSNDWLSQTNVFTSGKIYKVSFEVLDYTSGSINLSLHSAWSQAYSANGVYTNYLTATGVNLKFSSLANNFNGSITNISVKEVGQNWEFNSTAILTANGMNITTGGYIRQDVVTIGKSYKLTYDIVSYTSGDIRVYDGTDQGSIPTSVGSNTFNFTAGGSVFVIQSNSASVNLVITNISVIEITDDTSLPRINYEGFSYQDALGSELSSPLDFLNKWFGAGATSITNNSFEVNGSGQGMYFALGIDKEYKIKVSNVVGDVNVRYRNGLSGAGTVVGNFDEFIIINTFGSTNPNIYLRANSATSITVGDVSVKEYLGQEVVPGSGCGSWLWEPQTTQLVTYSELFSNAYWGNENVGTTPILETGFLAPDGTNNAFKISNANQNSFWYATTGGFNATTTRSIYARTVSGTGTAQLCSHNSNTNNTFTITEQWQRFELNATASAIGTDFFYAVDFRGSGTLSELILWGANATNDQDYATSYIPTEGSQVTRNQDVCTNGGSLASINSTEGVLYAEIAALADGGSYRIISLSDGTDSNRIIFFYDVSINRLSYQVRVGNDSQFNGAINNVSVLQFNKVALKYKENDFALWINGVEVAADAVGNIFPLNTLTKLSFSSGNASSNFFGKTKALAVWKEALSDQELAELTTI